MDESAESRASPTLLLNSEAKIGILIRAKRLKAIKGYSDGKVTVSLSGRVGRTGSTWDEKGTNDGANSDVSYIVPEPISAVVDVTQLEDDDEEAENSSGDGSISMGWCVYDTFCQSSKHSMELTVRLMVGPKSKVLGKDTKVSKVFDNFVGQTVAGELTMELQDLTRHEHVQHTIMGGNIDITITKPSTVLEMDQQQQANHSEITSGDNSTNHTKTKIVSGSYPCGTNHFGMLPIPKISKNDLINCTLWGEAREPTRTWVAVHLLFHYCPFQSSGLLVRSPIPPIPKQINWKGEPVQPTPKQTDWNGQEVTANPSGAKAGYGSAQAPDKFVSNAVPMLELLLDGTKKVLIADGVMINSLLIPALYGPESFTEDVLRWERKIGYDYVPAIWRDLSGRDYVNIYKRLAPNYPQAMKNMWSPLLRWPFLFGQKIQLYEISKIQSYMGSELYNNDLDTNIKDVIKEFHWELKATQMEYMGCGSGAESPGPIDLSFFGINVLYYVTEIGPIRKFMDKYGLQSWMNSMLQILPPKKCLSRDFFGPSFDGWKAGWLLEPPQADPVPLEPPPASSPADNNGKENDNNDDDYTNKTNGKHSINGDDEVSSLLTITATEGEVIATEMTALSTAETEGDATASVFSAKKKKKDKKFKRRGSSNSIKSLKSSDNSKSRRSSLNAPSIAAFN